MLADLIATDGVEERLVLGGPIGLMALHGGLEAGTHRVAGAVAEATGSSLYAIVQPDDHRWHVPSARHDPRDSERLTRFLEHVRLAVSIHGFGRRHLPDTVLVGGRNRRVARHIASAIRRHTDLDVIDEPAAMPRGLRGMHPANPVNLPESQGVQLELSRGARRDPVVGSLVAAVASVVAAESGSVCATA
ncbi:MAG: poly-gamma-glutamate hydrolase family protein [Acidimicrobiia bacterium]|nr:poly-gamma-glutamate hydrolase family protein [Acidimicrobiia bacterium]